MEKDDTKLWSRDSNQTASGKPGTLQTEWKLVMRPKLPTIILAALLAGTIAIVLNIFVLDALKNAGVETLGGGLQKLMRAKLSGIVLSTGLADAWASSGLPGSDAPSFKTGFKVTVGLLMALIYALLFEPLLRGSSFRKGLITAVPFWLLNAFVVLPLLGHGIAGTRLLTILGLLSYAFAHTLFFVIVALVYGELSRRFRSRHAPPASHQSI